MKTDTEETICKTCRAVVTCNNNRVAINGHPVISLDSLNIECFTANPENCAALVLEAALETKSTSSDHCRY